MPLSGIACLAISYQFRACILALNPYGKSSIVGVKSYPRGVTTNSDGGIESYEAYYPVFEAMQEVDMVLNLHGEVPSDASKASIIFCPWSSYF